MFGHPCLIDGVKYREKESEAMRVREGKLEIDLKGALLQIETVLDNRRLDDRRKLDQIQSCVKSWLKELRDETDVNTTEGFRRALLGY